MLRKRFLLARPPGNHASSLFGFVHIQEEALCESRKISPSVAFIEQPQTSGIAERFREMVKA